MNRKWLSALALQIGVCKVGTNLKFVKIGEIPIVPVGGFPPFFCCFGVG